MVSDDFAKQLHDRATRGKLLSEEELALLENWYALQDSAESNTLNLTASEETLATLQTQIEAALTQLMMVTKRIQKLASENEALRREIVILRRQLAYRPILQPV